MKSILILLVIAVLAGCSSSNEIVSVDKDGVTTFNNQNLELELSQLDSTDLSDEEKASLVFMREEEKLAYDVYSVLYEKWEHKSFDNISRSEQTHTNAVKTLLDKYSIQDPVKIETIGEFDNQDLQQLYNELVKQGETSLVEALKVGAIVEEIDIIDLQKYLKETNNPDIITVYENLLLGSKNHLRAFVKNLDKQGYTYIPSHLSEDEYMKIISST